jgi:hypothetical protein
MDGSPGDSQYGTQDDSLRCWLRGPDDGAQLRESPLIGSDTDGGAS